MNARDKQEKIVKMKMQTAKVLWGEGRKDAAFLVLESVDDPRADDLRDRMGFDDDYEIGGVTSGGVPFLLVGVGAFLLFVIAFSLGTFLNLGGEASSSQTLTENEIVSTIVAPTPEPGEAITEPLADLTGTASLIQLTQQAIQESQNSGMSMLDATETQRYIAGTATQNARATEAAGG
ncbi:MAG: hypothetical protein AAFR81_28755 [Chloroflexota bacterium]